MNQTRKDVLNGWKEIAAYLGRDPRTVERWEKQRSLPVRRLPGSGRATVYAFVRELDQWLLASSAPRETSGVLPPEAGAEPNAAAAAEGEPADPLAMPAVAVSDTPDRSGENANSPAVVAGGERRRWPWLRWTVPLTVALSLVWLSLSVARWRQERHSAADARSHVAASERLRKRVPTSPVLGVEELYLRGCYQAEMRQPESLRRAQEAFTEAISRDPRYAPAYAGLANTFLLLREYSMMPDAEAYPQAIEAAERALALDPDLPQAHAAAGFADFFWRWDSDAAQRQFDAALRLDPDLPLAHHWYGAVLVHQGRFQEARAELDVAQRLDPASAPILTMRALALGLSGQPAEASEMLRAAVSADRTGRYRNPATMHAVLGTLSLLPPRDIPSFLAETTLADELRQDTEGAVTLRKAGDVYRARGERAMWRALLEQEQRRMPGGSPTYQRARYEAELGDFDQSLRDLRWLFQRHDPALIGISVDPLFAGLQRESRFAVLRAAMGLPAVAQK